MPKFLLAFFVLIFSLFCTTGTAQEILKRPITLATYTYTLDSALQTAKAQGFPVAYSSSKLPNARCNFKSSQLLFEDFLKALKTQTGINYTVNGNIVAISYEKPTVELQTIRGTVRDLESGEALIGAAVYEPGSLNGVITNSYGYFSLSLSAGEHVVRVSFIGYEDILDTIDLSKGHIRNFMLAQKVNELNEITISAIEPDFNVSSLIPGINTLNLSTEGQIPYFLGEVDVLQGATLLPGIKTLGEDANGLNIRGGSTDQNLILLDEATVYNPNHLYGLISVFNPEAVNNVEIMKGFIPPSYGGRASSVISVHQKEGDDQNYHFTGGIGLVSARFIAEGPIKKKQSSFILSGRQSIFDLSLDNNTSTSFQDLNAKINLKYNKKNTFYFSGYFGNDRNTNTFETVRNWGNRNFSLRWNHLFGRRVFANFSAILSEYNYKITQPREAASFIGKSRIIDYTAKSDWGYVITPKHELKFGGSTIFHRLKPGDRIPFDEQTSSSNPLYLDSEHGVESAIYLSHEATLGKKFSALYGFRISSLHYLGAGTIYQYDPELPRSNESITDTLTFGALEIMKSYYGWEPRASVSYRLSEQASIKASYTKSLQYLHLISSTITPAPTDIWKLSDSHIAPTTSHHYSLGIYQNFKDNKWETYVDGYFKRLVNMVQYKDGADLLFNPNPETELLTGMGRAYGMEFFLKKNEGKFTGWLSYTLSRSEIKVAGQFDVETINNGRYFPSNYDKKHDISLVGIYKFLPRLSGSFSFKYNSGRPFTLPLGKYIYEGNLIPHFGNRNQSRLPDYHRLDLSVKWQGKQFKADGTPKRFEDYWTLVVYNAYGRNNVYSYFFKEDKQSGVTTIEPYTIFDSVIPAITYNFKF